MRIYIASSWRNNRQPVMVERLRVAGHEVYDFRNPVPSDRGFHWSDIAEVWKSWGAKEFRDALKHPLARQGYASDMAGLRSCDACVLVLPCGRSSHLEMGYAAGMKILTVILLDDGEPELMYCMADHLCLTMDEVCAVLEDPMRS